MANGKPVLKFIESWDEPGDVFVASFQARTGFEWEAGQFVQAEIPGLTDDPRKGRRALSIASWPSEGRLLLATLVERGEDATAFKEAFADLEAGEEIQVSPPAGRFTLVEDPEATHVFLALGIGATAIRSISHHAAQTLLNTAVRVVQTPVDGGYPFESDLRNLAKSYDNARYEQRPEPPATADALREAAGGDLEQAYFYAAGPAAEVMAVRKVLTEAGVPKDRMRLEIFSGYD